MPNAASFRPRPAAPACAAHSTPRPPISQHLLAYVELRKLKPLKIVVNAGNGGAGLIIDQLEPHLPFEFVKIHHRARRPFPERRAQSDARGESRAAPSRRSAAHGADFGLAWDGDYDRCFFFDEHGGFIEGYYLVGLLADAFCAGNRGGKVVHDPRLTWNTIEIVERCGGQPVLCKSGHAFIKQKMREVDAVYGGEMSAHHYFRHFAYCDSGMIPWLMVAQIMSESGRSPLELVGERIGCFRPAAKSTTECPMPRRRSPPFEQRYAPQAMTWIAPTACRLSSRIGASICAVRTPNRLIRLNVEARGSVHLMQAKTAELLVC